MENVLSILFCLSLFYVAVTSRVKEYVTILRFQGIILTISSIIPIFYHFSFLGLILPTTLLLVKVYLIPRYINKVILDLDIKRYIETTIQQMVFMPIVILSMIIIYFSKRS